VIPAAEKVVKWLNKHRLVKRISLGEIRKAGGGKQRIEIAQVNGGVRLTLHGGSSLQFVVVYTDAHMQLKKELRKEFAGRFDFE
jgi:hypothetical protein